MKIFPKPKKMLVGDCYKSVTSFKIVKNDFDNAPLDYALSKIKFTGCGTDFYLMCDSNYKAEEYNLKLSNNSLEIIASTSRGVFNALTTLRQVLNSKPVKCVEIYDEPDFDGRCVMIDVSRGRIPKVCELKRTIDFLADMKFNQLQLGFDDIVFEYEGFEKYYEGKDIVTARYLKEIKDHCDKNFIELIPNQNSFGHMEAWLKLEDFNHLSECPDGFMRTDEYNCTYHMDAGTLDPYDPGSLELMDKIYRGMLHFYDSGYFNVCCDETFELGKGKSKEKVTELGLEKVYTEYMNKLNQILKKYGKQMMFWADMIVDSVDALKSMPSDAIALVWGYEQEHPYEVQCRNLYESGLDFYVAPGTSSWGSIVGRSRNMLINQQRAAENGKKYGAKGYLLTDWGDCGHAQFPVITYVPFAYGAGLSWGTDENRDIENAYNYLDEGLFREKGFSAFLYDCGNAHCLEAYKRFNQTALVTALNTPLEDSYYLTYQTPEHFKRIIRHSEEQLEKLKYFNSCPDEHKNEISLNLRMLATIAKICVLKTGGSADKNEIIEEFASQNEEFKKMWLDKNLEYNVTEYIKKTQYLIEQLNDRE